MSVIPFISTPTIVSLEGCFALPCLSHSFHSFLASSPISSISLNSFLIEPTRLLSILLDSVKDDDKLLDGNFTSSVLSIRASVFSTMLLKFLKNLTLNLDNSPSIFLLFSSNLSDTLPISSFISLGKLFLISCILSSNSVKYSGTFLISPRSSISKGVSFALGSADGLSVPSDIVFPCLSLRVVTFLLGTIIFLPSSVSLTTRLDSLILISFTSLAILSSISWRIVSSGNSFKFLLYSLISSKLFSKDSK